MNLMKIKKLTYEDFIKKAEQVYHHSTPIVQIEKAYKYASQQHAGRQRLTKEDYIFHPLNVAYILLDLNVDVTTIVGALLHETINNGQASEAEIETLFGSEIKTIVSCISKINKLELSNQTDSAAIYLRKVLVGLAEDVRILYIKLADRLHNMRTIWAVNPSKQKRKAQETLSVLVPIAHRLGINSIKRELENLSLKYLKPGIYRDIETKLASSQNQLSSYLEEMKEQITELLIEHEIQFEIKSRVKSVYSIYNKLHNGKKWDEIYDFLALRVILTKESDCYLAVGLIHSKFRPVPNRFKDYIAMPKENLYQSLHTTIFGVDGQIFEIQLRTKEMDEIAEKGLASHWSYKEKGVKKVQNIMEQKLEMFRNAIENATENDALFASEVKSEFLNELIYVFTPKGDVVELPKEATPIDFAYRIHSDVGDQTVGALVNKTIVPLNYKLQNDDIVSIKTSKTATPNKDWLSFVKTSQAKNKIKAYFSKQERNYYIERGQTLLERELHKRKLVFSEIMSETNLAKLSHDLKLKDRDEIYLAIGSLRYTPGYIINLTTTDKVDVEDALIAKMNHNPNNHKNLNYKSDIIVSGLDDVLVSLARCCNPIKGDSIIGYITKGEGITIHKTDCPNLKSKKERLIKVKWNPKTTNCYFKDIVVDVVDYQNYLIDIITLAATKDIVIDSVATKLIGNQNKYYLTIKVHNQEEFQNFCTILEKQKYILMVEK